MTQYLYTSTPLTDKQKTDLTLYSQNVLSLPI
jgi:hypothetical protein